MNSEALISLLSAMADCIAENKVYLTELDIAIGDGDHGVNMDRGFAAIREKLPIYAGLSCGAILTDAGKTLIRQMAGSSGPLYGSVFKCGGKAVGEKDTVTYGDLVTTLDEGIRKIQMLGGAVEGEKTMLDAMFPALRALREESDPKAGLAKAAEAAHQAAEHTKEIIATKGRASYLGERSLGHIDPGAASFTLLMTVIRDAV